MADALIAADDDTDHTQVKAQGTPCHANRPRLNPERRIEDEAGLAPFAR
jgi:hypothetical protein